MRIKEDIKLNFDDVLMEPKRSTLSSRRDVDMTRKFTFINSGKVMNFTPIFASNMDGVGTFSMAKVLQEHKMMTVITKSTPLDKWKEAVGTGLRLQSVSVSVGTNKMWDNDAADYRNMEAVLQSFPDVKMITVDVANAYHQNFVDFIKKVRDDYPEKVIVAGNVVTPEMVEELIINGADMVKIGIGPGSVCTTRTMTGVGVPQFSAILECADAANGVDGHIMADGGCVYPGDIAKALGGGAHAVMIGGMLAGHNESEIQVEDGKREFYGMSSDRAREIHGKRKDGYRGNEGRHVSLPDRGPVNDTVEDILGGIRSAATYIGARRLKDMPKCSTFVRVENNINRVYERYTK
ncbi:MAG: GMP reductase [Candidatus Pelagibacter sp. TMED202]|jgi:GMP reductase|nr:MAG: GMP reductase [Candidatus Pelagibacter sp. TMED202]|tara:strand:+ start:7851 stop:8900 length:1050 start_codon:yes stop_codon:yes gene_type:complete